MLIELPSTVFVFLTSYLDDQIKKDKTGRACSMQGGQQKCIQDSDERPEGKTFGRPEHKLDNIKM